MKHLFLLAVPLTLAAAEPNFGTLIFEDHFERTESQELKDEPGNDWTTSSETTAKGHKQVDLQDGSIFIETHAEANHATSFRHAFEFQDGTVGLRFKLPTAKDSLNLNFADLGLKTVHAGHLFKVVISPTQVSITDQKNGEMNLLLRNAKKAGTLTDEQRHLITTKNKRFPVDLTTGEWHQVHVSITGDILTCRLNGQVIGTFTSEGFAHPTKKLLRLLVAETAFIDDVQIWKAR